MVRASETRGLAVRTMARVKVGVTSSKVVVAISKVVVASSKLGVTSSKLVVQYGVLHQSSL